MHAFSDFDLFNPGEEYQMLRKTVRDFVAREVEPQAQEYDSKEEFNIGLLRKLGGLGLTGLTVPAQYGGAGMDATAVVIVHEELASSDPGFCLAYLAHTILCANNIAVNANPGQCKKYLPALCSADAIGAMAISEPGSGTDVLGMSCIAEKKSDHYIVNGRKMWITNGTIDDGKTPCDTLVLYALTKGSPDKKRVSTFIIEAGFEGFSVGQKITGKTGMRASNTAELCFDNCKVPLENLVDEEGESLTHMMRNLELERVALAAMSLGIARRSLEIMIKYADERKAFGRKIAEFGQIQRYIGQSYAEYRAARSYVYNTAREMKLDSAGQRLDSDGVKLFAARAGKTIADRAIQVLGGYGYVREYVVERLWRDAKLLEIGGGTIEAHQKNITRDLLKQTDKIINF
ncbi:MAG: isovaleryl-CoA dehydrogenase [Candidatus Dadabacteria bacterium]|nr:MAG: isovaleryl-CoA dehydrogenase [Candidatus Dadabacteria bacterium]